MGFQNDLKLAINGEIIINSANKTCIKSICYLIDLIHVCTVNDYIYIYNF